MNPGKTLLRFIPLILLFTGSIFSQTAVKDRWPVEKAFQWYARQPWIVGCNFIPSTAINQLEMWQKETFDPATIDRELGWAQDVGFNTMRVFLHFIPWQTDSAGFFTRTDAYLAIASRHGIRTMFVLFDDCWNRDPQPGIQPSPKPGVHNSGWMQCPGEKMLKDSTTYPALLKYARSVVARYARDARVLLWDLYNEPGNSDYGVITLPLLRSVVAEARRANPTQPISVGTWMSDEGDFKTLNAFQRENSDVITFHSYSDLESSAKLVNSLRAVGRPMICTEYMARTRNSRFSTHLPLFKAEGVGAINWGLVSGKTNTIFPWESKPDSPEPAEWFHDIFRANGAPYRSEETSFIRTVTMTSSSQSPAPSISQKVFGSLPDGRSAILYTLRSSSAMEARITNFGGIVVSLTAPDRTGKLSDIVLGFDDLDSYFVNKPYLGAIIGRVGNRIGKAQFTLEGKKYSLAANNGANHLHGGIVGFDKVLWDAHAELRSDGPALILTYLSKDGEEGYPGNLSVTVTYTLTNAGELRIDYSATTDRTTVINLTHHSYFNLAGAGNGDILSHVMHINADRFTQITEELIPTGHLQNVAGTPFDFRSPVPIGRRISEKNDQIRFGRGYDHNWVLNRTGSGLLLAARVTEPISGRILEVWTTEPGVQFYCGNFLDGTDIGKGGIPYLYRMGFCLETQHFPDSPNQPSFPSIVLKPGKTYTSTTVYRFKTE